MCIFFLDFMKFGGCGLRSGAFYSAEFTLLVICVLIFIVLKCKHVLIFTSEVCFLYCVCVCKLASCLFEISTL